MFVYGVRAGFWGCKGCFAVGKRLGYLLGKSLKVIL
jgi:hypothetical protein